MGRRRGESRHACNKRGAQPLRCPDQQLALRAPNPEKPASFILGDSRGRRGRRIAPRDDGARARASQEDAEDALGGCSARAEAHEGRNMKKRAKAELEEMFGQLGELDEVRALTSSVADALQKATRKQKVTPAEMARRMGTSRPTVYRLLDPTNGARRWTLSRGHRVRWGSTLKSSSCPSRDRRRGDSRAAGPPSQGNR
jgi:hypothetical protein